MLIRTILFALLLVTLPSISWAEKIIPKEYFIEGVLSDITGEDNVVKQLPASRLSVNFLGDLTQDGGGSQQYLAWINLSERIRASMNVEVRVLSSLRSPFSLQIDDPLLDQRSWKFKEGMLSILLTADTERAVRTLDIPEQLPRHGQLKIRNVPLSFGCRLKVIEASRHMIGALLAIPHDISIGDALYCTNFSVLSAAGFRGVVRSLSNCKSVRCLGRASTTMTENDYQTLAALYRSWTFSGMSSDEVWRVLSPMFR